MKIDIFPHIIPGKYYETLGKIGATSSTALQTYRRAAALPALRDLDTRLRIMHDFEDYVQVLTLSGPPIEQLGAPHETPDLAKLANDEMAELVAKYPNRFLAAVAALPLNNIEASIREMDRAVTELGFKGVQIFTNVNGKPLDDPQFLPIFERMAKYDLPIWLHPRREPTHPDYDTEAESKYQIWFCFGWPYETGAAMTRIAFAGLFDKYPNLKIITHHMGGVVTYFGERIRGTYDQYETRMRKGEENVLQELKRHPYEYFRMFYNDTSIYGSIPAMECGLAFSGSDRILFGTDMPFDVEGGYRYIRETIRAIEGMTTSPEDKKKIFEENAKKLLKLTI